MSCLLCMGTEPLTLQTPPPTELLVHVESCPYWWTDFAAPFSCFSGFSTGCGLLEDCSLCWEGGQGASALSTTSGSVPSRSHLLGNRKTRRKRSQSDVEDLDLRKRCEFCMLGCSREAGSGQGEHSNWEVRRVENKSEAEVFFHGLESHGNALNHCFTSFVSQNHFVFQNQFYRNYHG